MAEVELLTESLRDQVRSAADHAVQQAASNGSKAKQDFINACVKNKEWDSIAFVLCDSELREEFQDEIEKVAILLPENFVDYLEQEAEYVAGFEFHEKAAALTEEVERLQEAQNNLISESEAKKAEIEAERQVEIKSIQDLDNNEVKAAKTNLDEATKALAKENESRKAVVADVSRRVPTFENDVKKLEDYNNQLDKLKLKIEQEKSSIGNTLGSFFGAKSDDLKQLETRAAQLEEDITKLKEPYQNVEKTGVMVSQMLDLHIDMNKKVAELQTKVNEAKATLEAAENRADAGKKVRIASTNKRFAEKSARLGVKARNNAAKLKEAKSELKYHMDNEGDNIGTGQTEILQANGVFSRGASEQPLIIDNIRPSLIYLEETNRIKEAMDYLIAYPDAAAQEFFTQHLIAKGKIDKMIEVVAAYGNPDLSYNFAVDLVSKLKSFENLEKLIEPLNLNDQQKEGVAKALVGRMELIVSKSIMDSIGKGVEFSNQLYDALIGVEDKKTFTKIITGYGVSGKFDEVLDIIVGIDDEAKRYNFALKLLDVKDVEALGLADKLKLSPDHALKLMDKMVEVRGDFKGAYEELKVNVEPAVLTKFAEKHIKTLDDLLFYANSFENKVEGSKAAGKLIAERLIAVQLRNMEKGPFEEQEKDPIIESIKERGLDDALIGGSKILDKTGKPRIGLDNRIAIASILGDALKATGVQGKLLSENPGLEKAVESSLNNAYRMLRPAKVPQTGPKSHSDLMNILKDFEHNEGVYIAIKIAAHKYRQQTGPEKLSDDYRNRAGGDNHIANMLLYDKDLRSFNGTRDIVNKMPGFGEELTLFEKFIKFLNPFLEAIGYMPEINDRDVVGIAKYIVGITDAKGINQELRTTGVEETREAARDAMEKLGAKFEANKGEYKDMVR